MAWPTVMVKVSPPFKEALEEAAKNAHMSISQYVRACLAEKAGYNLAADDALDGRGRPATYLTPEQRKEARKRSERERTEHNRRVVAAIMKQERLDGVAALEDYLKRKGISLTDDEQAEEQSA